MQYRILGGSFPVVEVSLEGGESMYTEKGAMAWMSSNIAMDTNMKGGFLKGLGRVMSGESLFMASYECTGGSGIVSFGSTFAGEIKVLDLKPGQSVICQKDAFLAAQSTVSLSVEFKRRLGTGFFGGEGFIMQRIKGPGIAFAEIDGSVVEYDLAPGQVLKVDTGYVAMYEDTVSMDITSVGGFKNVLFGGEGLFLTTLKGPGHIWLQTMPLSNFVNVLMSKMPAHKD